MMYFFQFMKWFWTRYLTDGEERFFAGVCMWLAICIIGEIISLCLGIGAAFIFVYLILTVISIVLSLFVLGFLYMRRRYLEWQAQVFDKLKGK